MGSNISIRNGTELTLNISLRQVCPLYQERGVKPGETMTRTVGKVWFTINVQWMSSEVSWHRVYMGSNRRFEIRRGPRPTRLEINGVPDEAFESRTLKDQFVLFDLDSNLVLK